MCRLRVLLSLAWCAFASAEAAPAPAAPFPIEHFTRHDEFGDMRISPDGKYVAMSVGKYGRSALAVLSRAEERMVGGVRAPDGLEIDEFHWVSPTRLVYMVAQREPGRATPYQTGEIVAIDFDGSRQVPIYGYRAGSTVWGASAYMPEKETSYAHADLVSELPDDDRHVLITEQPWKVVGGYWQYDRDAKPTITLLDVYDGRKKELGIAPLASARLLVDRNYQPRFALGYKRDGELGVAWRPELAANWREFGLPGYVPDTVVPLHFATDNASVYFTAIREGSSHAALYRLTLESGAVETVAALPDADILDVVTDLELDKVVGYRTYGERPMRVWLEPDDPSTRFYVAMERAFAGQSARVTSVTRDGGVAVVFVYSDVNPGQYFLVDTAALKAKAVRKTRGWIDPRTMRPKEPVTLAARDGLQLQGYLTRPAGPGPHALVVLPHGGPHGVRDAWGYDWEAQLLASRGYAVLQVNYRGSSGYGLAFEQAGYREWGGKMQDDVTDATRWAIEQKVADPARVCIYGASYGGYAAMMGAAREPKLYRCAIGYAGVYDLELMRKTGDIPDSSMGRAYLDKVLGDDPAQLRARSPTHLAGAIEVPTLLIHGKADYRADFDQAKAMRAALEKNAKSFEWMAVSREGHGMYEEDTRREVYDRILAFLDRNIGASARP